MKNQEKSKVKSDVISGLSSSVGATIGMVAGSVLSAELNASEVDTPEVGTDGATGHNSSSPQQQVAEPVKPTESADPVIPIDPVEPEPPMAPVEPETPAELVGPEIIAEPIDPLVLVEPVDLQENVDIEVLGYETMMTEDGQMVDVATVNINGNEGSIVDTDMDDVANLMTVDANSNANVEENEITDVSGDGISMAPFRDVVNPEEPNYLTNNEDYVNDADVTDFMA